MEKKKSSLTRFIDKREKDIKSNNNEFLKNFNEEINLDNLQKIF